MTRLALKLLPLLALILLPGCVVGYNSVLFATKSNAGFDFDAAPPTAELAISRVEGVIEPTFEGGRTLPVMASFKTEGEGLFAGGVGQTFTTGDAAVVMATLYGDEFPHAGPGLDWEEHVAHRFDSALVLDNKPKIKLRDVDFARNDVKPVFFGTSTSLGLKVSWSGIRGPNPDSLHLGYKRKELAWAPISMEVATNGAGGTEMRADEGGADAIEAEPVESQDTTYHMRVPSLLATIDASGDVRTPQQARFDWLQYFATGRSATALALRREVRLAMLRRLDPAATFDEIEGTYGPDESSAIIKEWLDNDDEARSRRAALRDWIEANAPRQEGVAPDITTWRLADEYAESRSRAIIALDIANRDH
ncbi:MAG: hypothetical protein SYC29_08165 [Planctomycetota bacterium]|nr:hypothetical protein [Planctomycetota bacterium]